MGVISKLAEEFNYIVFAKTRLYIHKFMLLFSVGFHTSIDLLPTTT